jgi:hypothetical protein
VAWLMMAQHRAETLNPLTWGTDPMTNRQRINQRNHQEVIMCLAASVLAVTITALLIMAALVWHNKQIKEQTMAFFIFSFAFLGAAGLLALILETLAGV